MSISILHLNLTYTTFSWTFFFIFFIFFHKPGTRPSGKKYVSACNYLNTMGSSGNAPSRGCAPHCWMGFRMLELAQMRDVLPTPPALHLNNITKIPVRVSNNDDVPVAAVVEVEVVEIEVEVEVVVVVVVKLDFCCCVPFQY